MDKAELRARLRDHEDGWVERKTKNIKSDEICEALTGFANSLPPGEKGILFVGVSNDGQPLGVDDTDGMQKKVDQRSKWCYPPVPYTARVFEESGVNIVAVIVEASKERPHFAGPAFIRAGSQNKKASPEKFNELIDRRISVVDAMISMVFNIYFVV